MGAVCGVRGIRVADASIHPAVPASNTMWAIVIFAETIGSVMRDEREIRWGSKKGRDCGEPALTMFRDSVGFEQWPVEKTVRQKRVCGPVQIEFYAVLLQ